MKKIVIVEDDELVAKVYGGKLRADGYQVEVAPDGEQGLKCITRWQPDLVILDLMVPKLSGVELLQQLRARPGLQSLPVVVFSSSYLSQNVEAARQAGATECLSKATCTPRHLLELVRSLTSPPAAAASSESADDLSNQAGLRRTFADSLPATLKSLRAGVQSLIHAPDAVARVEQLEELFHQTHALTGKSGIAGLPLISEMSDALEALLKELCGKPGNLNASSIRTVTLAIDFLGVLFERCQLPEAQAWPGLGQAAVLVVDDEAISRRAVEHALKKAGLQSLGLEDPQAALELLKTKTFDLVFLDVDMPGMTGFELCAKLRALPAHKKTPVVFVTGLTDFESRASSTISGGNDLIAKPFLFMELAVKAIIYILRARLN